MTAVGYVGGDPDKLDRAGYTLGDVLAADATGTLIPVALGTPAEVLTVDLAEPADVGWGAAGGGAALAVRQSYLTSGDVAFPNTLGAWQAVAGISAPAIPAAVGDFIEVAFTALFDFAATSFVDVAVSAAGSLVRFMATGTGTPAVEGNPGLYPDPAFDGYFGTQGFTVAAPDISGGNVTVVLAVLATGSGLIKCSAAFPVRWIVKNYGPVV